MNKVLYPVVIMSYISLLNVAMAADVTSGLVGTWVGDGFVRTDGFGAVEAIRCKVSGKKISGQQISFGGLCATAGGSGEFRMSIVQDAQGSQLRALVRLSTASEAVAYSGNAAQGILTLMQDKPVTNGDITATSTIRIGPGAGGVLIMNSRVTDIASGRESDALSITFRRTGD